MGNRFVSTTFESLKLRPISNRKAKRKYAKMKKRQEEVTKINNSFNKQVAKTSV